MEAIVSGSQNREPWVVTLRDEVHALPTERTLLCRSWMEYIDTVTEKTAQIADSEAWLGSLVELERSFAQIVVGKTGQDFGMLLGKIGLVAKERKLGRVRVASHTETERKALSVYPQKNRSYKALWHVHGQEYQAL